MFSWLKLRRHKVIIKSIMNKELLFEMYKIILRNDREYLCNALALVDKLQNNRDMLSDDAIFISRHINNIIYPYHTLDAALMNERNAALMNERKKTLNKKDFRLHWINRLIKDDTPCDILNLIDSFKNY